MVLLSGVVAADNVDVLQEATQSQPSTEAPPAAVVAAELLRIQAEMGGSIVQAVPLFKEPAHYETPPSVPTSDTTACPLREAAWQLDLVARRLELAEQIQQADAVRDLSDQLRGDARAVASQSRQSSGGQ